MANIYDLAGNVSEMTTEVSYSAIFNAEYPVLRSGTQSYHIGSASVNVRTTPSVRGCPNYGGKNYVNSEVGFRVALFVR